MTFKKEIENFKKSIDNYLSELVGDEISEDSIKNSMKYSLLANGKRVRPILLILISKALGKDINKALPFAAAIECIHTYSLIHDDLPAMDDDDLRRGMPTNHIKFGEATAILAGDALLNLSFEIIFDEIEKTKFNPYYVKAGKVISTASGSKGMILGQVIDIESEGKDISLDRLIDMHSKKTGALIEAACICGALIAEREDLVSKISEYGKNVGLVFQIIDDVLDYIGDKDLIGKNIGSDKLNKKSTFVTILGIEKSLELSKSLTSKAIEISNEIDSSGLLSQYTKFLLNRDR